LYRHADYQPRGEYLYADTTGNYGLPADWDNQLSSVLLRPGWSVRLYKDAGHSGTSKCFTSDDSDFSNDTFEDGSPMNDQVSSLSLYNQTSCPSNDTEPPVVNWIRPVGNEQVHHASSGTVQLEASATDNVGVNRVVFNRWDAENQQIVHIATDYSPPYLATVDVAALNMVWNQINAVAYDAVGNVSGRYIWIFRDDPNPVPENRIQMYLDMGYQNGYCYMTGEGWGNLAGGCDQYDNQVSSVLLQPGWSVRFFKEANLGGASKCIASSDPDFSNDTFDDGTPLNDAVSSLYLYHQATCPTAPPAPSLISPPDGSTFNEDEAITLSWSATANEYYGEIWGGPAGTLTFGWQSGTSVNIGPQWAGYTYYWHVKARHNYGESVWSSTWSFVVRPAAPSSLVAQTPSCTQVSLTWADNSGNEEGYRVYRNNTLLAQLEAGRTGYTDPNVNENTSYTYVVRAFRGSIESAPSNTANVTTPRCPTATPTRTFTHTPTWTPTWTAVATLAPTSTSTRTPTYTPTGIATNLPTGTPTNTPFLSATATRTGTGVASTETATPVMPTSTSISTATGTSTRTGTHVTTPSPTASATPCPIGFSDVSPDDYFYEPVRYLYCRGVISGYADNTFRPYNDTTRGQLTKIVMLAERWPLYSPPEPTFSDVPADHPFYPFVETAYREEIISGYLDGTFRPYNNVTRGQLAKIVVLAEEWALYILSTPTFTDVLSDNPFYAFVETAYQHTIISGYLDGTFRPYNNATRGQICKIIYSAITQP
jgi:hypothetical protein